MSDKLTNIPPIAPKQEQAEGEQTSKVEQFSGLEDLMSLAQETMAEPLNQTEQLQKRTQELQEAEQERIEEKSQLEKGVEFSLDSGKIHYLELTNPKAYYELKMQEITERQKIANESEQGHKALGDRVWFTNQMNSVKDGFLWSEMPYLRGAIEATPIRGTTEYLSSVLKAAEKIEAWNAKEQEYLDDVKEGRENLNMMEIGGKWIHGDKPEDVKEYVAQEQAKLEEKKKSLKLFIEKQAGGFGWAAMENKDLEVAIPNLAAAGVLENPDVVARIKEQMLELKNSINPEDKFKIRKVSEILLAIKGNK